MSWLGVDVGGTFTDLVFLDRASGRLQVLKTPSTPDDQSEGILVGIGRLSLEPGGLERIVHGTTVATNTALEGDGARLAVLATEGHRDVLVVGRGNRMAMYNIKAPAQSAAGAAIALLRSARTPAGRRHRVRAARRGGGGRDRAPARRGSDRGGRGLLPSFLRQRRARAPVRGDPAPLAARRRRHDLVRGLAGIPRVRTLLDDGSQCLCGAAHAPVSERIADPPHLVRHLRAACPS